MSGAVVGDYRTFVLQFGDFWGRHADFLSLEPRRVCLASAKRR